jgi:hypothetical protein
MIDISNVEKKLKAGLIALAKVGNAYALSKKRFDPETGKEVEPEVQALDLADLESQKSKLLDAANQIDVLISHLKSL